MDQFTTLLIKSRLLSEHEARVLATVFQEQCRKQSLQGTVELFCDFLISTNHLTQWQCEKLRMGKWKGFYLGKYLLLEHIGKDDEPSYFTARDTDTGNVVRVAVTPGTKATSGNIEYRVYSHSE